MSVRVTSRGTRARLRKIEKRVAAMSAPPSPNRQTWTTKPPAKRGWYWREDVTCLQVVWVSCLPASGKKRPVDVWVYFETGISGTCPVRESVAYWMGPIRKPPKPPELSEGEL